MQPSTYFTVRAALPIALLLLLSHCVVDETIDENQTPVANAGKDQLLDTSSDRVHVRLDGSKSLDHDGRVVTYRWLSADRMTDGGPTPPDPEDVAKPELELARGSYTFTLWAIDDHGSVSKPDSVTVRAGTDPVAECVAQVKGEGSESCKQCLCAGSDQCRTDVIACDDDCWALITCVGQHCPDATDVACIVTNCGEFLVGSAGDQATAAGTCAVDCAAACAVGAADAGAAPDAGN